MSDVRAKIEIVYKGTSPIPEIKLFGNVQPLDIQYINMHIKKHYRFFIMNKQLEHKKKLEEQERQQKKLEELERQKKKDLEGKVEEENTTTAKKEIENAKGTVGAIEERPTSVKGFSFGSRSDNG